MGDNLHRSFALLIAQVLPGLILVFGFTRHVPALQNWLGAAATAEITVGGTVMVLMLAIACSLVLNGARYLVYERTRAIERRCVGDALRDAPRKLGSVAEEDQLMIHHYAYYQFFGATAIAWPFVVVLNLGVPLSWSVKVAGLCAAVVIEYVLDASACDAIGRYLKKKVAIVQVPTTRSA